ncbi:SAM-dependent methyltransferase [Amycolatopsis alba]|uniref:SAM-dependent methyltransferase n=1 Tax=Amycolatopsis alba TaxID=76020 RepID=UPI000371CDC3|nr:SAM-dependent methyltransferase [Amycolatopsis alba]
MPDANTPPAHRSLDPEKPSIARVNDYFLGGSFNTPVDRAFAARALRALPAMKTAAMANRHFLRRVVTYLVENGVRQFVDLGCGIPTVGGVHHVARALTPDTPDTAVVYVDNDPIAVAQSKRLLRDDPATVVLDADLRHPTEILDHPAVHGLLDFTRPIAVLMIGVLHFIPDRDNPHRILAGYRDNLPRGSYLALSHLSDEAASPELQAQVRDGIRTYQNDAGPLAARSHATLASWLTELEIIPPGITIANAWRATTNDPTGTDHDLVLGAVARLP